MKFLINFPINVQAESKRKTCIHYSEVKPSIA